MENKKDDFRFSGRGALGAGNYGDLHFSGSGTINGDITCVSLSCSGSVTAEGNIDCDRGIRCSGSFHCKGNVRTGEMESSGSCRIDGDLEAQALESSGSVRVAGDFSGKSVETSGMFEVEGNIYGESLETSGSLRVGKNLKAESIETSGSLHVEGDCEVETFDSSGRLDIRGLLNAGTVEITLGKTESRVGEIGGETIEVKRKQTSGFFGLSPVRGMLVTNSIEGDEIYLENTKVKNVRGEKVYVGSGCEIETVEYTGSFEKAGDAVVKDLVRQGEENI